MSDELALTPASPSAPATAEVRELFYFSRNCSPPFLADKWLISGIIEAPDMEAAKQQLSAALGKQTTRVTDFDFRAVKDIERAPSGLVAITMGEAS